MKELLFHKERNRTFSLSKFSVVMLIVVCLYVVLLLINSNRFGLGPIDELTLEQSVSQLFLNTIVVNDKTPLLAKTIWYGAVHTVYGITGQDWPIIWRATAMLFAVLSLLVFYSFSRLFFNRNLALFCMGLLALDPMFFAFGRLASPDIVMLFFLLVNYYLVFLYVRDGVKKDFFYAGLFLGLALACRISPFLLIFLLPLLPFLYNKETIAAKLRLALVFILFALVGYVFGQSIFFFKSNTTHLDFIHYQFSVITAQLLSNSITQFHTISPAWSWFVIPQIETILRLENKTFVQVIEVFQNPIVFITTVPIIVASLWLLVKQGIKKNKLICNLLVYFAGLYLPWLVGFRAWYGYLLPLLPLIIVLLVYFVSQLKYTKAFLFGIGLFTVFTFALYYPLLTAISVPKTYDTSLFHYSLYQFSKTDNLLCQHCYPRK